MEIIWKRRYIYIFFFFTFILIKMSKFSKISLFISITLKFIIFTHHSTLNTSYCKEMYRSFATIHKEIKLAHLNKICWSQSRSDYYVASTQPIYIIYLHSMEIKGSYTRTGKKRLCKTNGVACASNLHLLGGGRRQYLWKN